MPHFRVKDIPTLVGLHVEAAPDPDGGEYLVVSRLIDRGSVVGDREVSFPVAPGSLLIHRGSAEPVDDPGRREFASDNPWGALSYESQHTRGTTRVSVAAFERATQVTVAEVVGGATRTLFSGYFSPTTEAAHDIVREVEAYLVDGEDAGDLVLWLREREGI